MKRPMWVLEQHLTFIGGLGVLKGDEGHALQVIWTGSKIMCLRASTVSKTIKMPLVSTSQTFGNSANTTSVLP